MAAAPKRTPLPAILIANDLLDGDVVFGTVDGFTRDPALALVVHEPTAADHLEAAGKRAMAERRVVDAYLVDVTLDRGRPVPRHYRERQRTLGPSNRPDLGKQAEFARA